MRSSTFVLVLVLTTSLPTPATAQEPLTLGQAIDAALARNRALLASRSTVDEAAAGMAEAHSNRLPRLTVAESWQRGDQPVFVFGSLLSARRFATSNFAIDALNHPDPIGFHRTTVGVEHTLFDGGQRSAASSVASLQRDMAEMAVAQASSDLVLSVTTAYGHVITALAAHRSAQAGLDAAKEDLVNAEQRRDEGILSDADVLDLALHVSELEERVIQASGDATIARAQLSYLMGRAPDLQFSLVEPTLPLDPHHPDLPALLAQAVASRPDLLQAEAASRVADAQRRSAKGALLPQVSTHASVDFSGTRLNDRVSSWLVGGELRWTFGLGGAERARARAAAHAVARTRTEQADTRARLEVDVLTAVRQVETTDARQLVGMASVARARESQRIVRDRFTEGLADSDDVLRASAAVLDAEARRTAALVDGLVARAMLSRAVGRTPQHQHQDEEN
jgi:outer membrane protein